MISITNIVNIIDIMNINICDIISIADIINIISNIDIIDVINIIDITRIHCLVSILANLERISTNRSPFEFRKIFGRGPKVYQVIILLHMLQLAASWIRWVGWLEQLTCPYPKLLLFLACIAWCNKFLCTLSKVQQLVMSPTNLEGGMLQPGTKSSVSAISPLSWKLKSPALDIFEWNVWICVAGSTKPLRKASCGPSRGVQGSEVWIWKGLVFAFNRLKGCQSSRKKSLVSSESRVKLMSRVFPRIFSFSMQVSSFCQALLSVVFLHKDQNQTFHIVWPTSTVCVNLML